MWKATDELRAKQREDAHLVGRFHDRWEPAVKYSRLAGNAHGIIRGRLRQVTGDLSGMVKANAFLKKLQWLETGNLGLDGGISGSYLLHGQYERFEVLNWAVNSRGFLDVGSLDYSGTGNRRHVIRLRVTACHLRST